MTSHGWARLLSQTWPGLKRLEDDDDHDDGGEDHGGVGEDHGGGGEDRAESPHCPVSVTSGRKAGGTCWPARSPPLRATGGLSVYGATTWSEISQKSFASSAAPETGRLQSFHYL